MKRTSFLALALSLAVLSVSAANGWAQAPKPSERAVAKATTTANAPAKTFVASAVRQAAFRKSASLITGAQLKDYLSFVASDEMEGRTTPSRGLDTTARFIATQLSRWGVKPAGDEGTYFQKITLKKEKLVPEGTEVDFGGRKFTYGKDFLAAAPGGSASGAMVFAGDGWFVKDKGIDAYKDIDPKGKIVIVTQGGMPPGLTQQDMMKLVTGGKRGEDWMDPMAYARKKGAVAVIVLQSLFAQANPDAMAQARKATEEGTFTVEKLAVDPGQAPLPTVVAHLPLAQAILAREKPDVRTILMSFPGGTPVKPFALADDKKISITVKTSSETVTSQNVVAVVEGSDPSLKQEYVALGAHYDHSGTATNAVKGDAILNGADDDGSGTVALLAMAEALARSPERPKRSTLFVWHMGEERGMWGSRYFTQFPTVPLEKVVAQLNIDMIGRSRPEGDNDPRNKDLSGPNELYVIGSKMMSTELGALSESVNDAYLKLSFNYKYDDPKDPERFFYRSDHISYARKNIPIIFYFTGVHADYHQVSDEVSKIDFPKFEKITRTIFATMWELAEMKSRPKVDKELPAEARGFGF